MFLSVRKRRLWVFTWQSSGSVSGWLKGQGFNSVAWAKQKWNVRSPHWAHCLVTHYLCGSSKAKWELGEVLADTLLSWTLWSIPIQEGAVTDRPEHLESRSSWHLTGLFPFLTVVGFFLGRFQMSGRNPRAHPYAVRSPSQSSVKGLHFQVQDEWSLRNFPDIADSMITSLFFLCHLAWMPPTFFRWFEQRTHQKV